MFVCMRIVSAQAGWRLHIRTPSAAVRDAER